MAKKKALPKSYEKLQDLASKTRVELQKILKIIGKEADLSSKFLKGKLDVINLNTGVEKRYRELGKETYDLVAKGKITDSGLKSMCNELDVLYGKIDQKKKKIGKLKEQIKKPPR